MLFSNNNGSSGSSITDLIEEFVSSALITIQIYDVCLLAAFVFIWKNVYSIRRVDYIIGQRDFYVNLFFYISFLFVYFYFLYFICALCFLFVSICELEDE